MVVRKKPKTETAVRSPVETVLCRAPESHVVMDSGRDDQADTQGQGEEGSWGQKPRRSLQKQDENQNSGVWQNKEAW